MKPIVKETSLLNKLCRIIGNAVFPSSCLVCGCFYQPPERRRRMPAAEFDLPASARDRAEVLLAEYLCLNCIRGMIAVESPLCPSCGLPFESRHGVDHPCADCRTSPKKFRIARAPLIYEKILAQVIHCFKYKGKIQLARPLGDLLLAAFRFFWDADSIDVVTPVPLHVKRFRQRGFNQAYLLLRNWPAIAGAGSFGKGGIVIERDVLVRAIATPSQTGLGRRERAANIKNAFDVVDPAKISEKRVLLVDDIYTTGATVNECARLLLAHGAKHVDVLSLARAV